MKLLYIDPQSFDNLSVYDTSLLSSLKVDINVVYLCSTRYDLPLLERSETIRVFDYNNKKGIYKILSYCGSLLKVWRIAKRYSPDVVHIQWLKIPQLDCLFYKLLKKTTHARLAFTAHNVLPHDSGDRYKRVFRRFYGEVDGIIVHDNNSKNDLIKEFCIPSSIVWVIRHGLLRYSYDNDTVEREKKDVTSKYHLDNKLVFSVLGIQSKYKGTQEVLEAWMSNEKLYNSNTIHLLVAGRCKELDYSKYTNVENITIEDGYISSERMKAIMLLTDVFLLPYKRISQSGILLSALELSRPFIVTDVGGLAEPLTIADVGWKIEGCTPNAIAKVLLKLVEGPNEVRIKKENTEDWARVKNAYSWNHIGDQTSTFYSKLLGQ